MFISGSRLREGVFLPVVLMFLHDAIFLCDC